MEMIGFILLILVALIINIVFVRIWMIIANMIGEILGISKFINWIISKFKAYIS